MKTMMKAWMLVMLSLALPVSAAAPTELPVAPDFSVQAAKAGQEVSVQLSALLKQGPVVLYFYPKAFTSGCTVQAHAFAESIAEFEARKVTVIGMSGDDIETLKKFSVSECSNKFLVAADPGLKIAKQYGAAGAASVAGMAKRNTYVIAQNGRILKEISGVAPGDHAKLALQVLDVR